MRKKLFEGIVIPQKNGIDPKGKQTNIDIDNRKEVRGPNVVPSKNPGTFYGLVLSYSKRKSKTWSKFS